MTAWLRLLSFFGIFAFVPALLPAIGVAQQSSRETEFARDSIPLLAGPKRNPLGTVTPGTPLAIVKQKDGLTEVRIDGWSMVGAAQIVFAAKGQRIALARLTSADPLNRKVISQSKDVYGIDWQRVVVTGWVSSKDLVPRVSSVWHQAAALFKKRCTACHALHQPTEFTANQWPHILRVMTKRAGLTAEEADLVTKYLQTHARSQAVGQPGGPAVGRRRGQYHRRGR